MTTSNSPADCEKLGWSVPELESLGTMDDIRSGGIQGGPDFEFEPTDPAS